MIKHNPHILVVDDHKNIRDPLAEYLGKNGFRVSKAANGEEMDQVLSKAAVDLIVLDILMPNEDGLTICRRIRNKIETPIILLTAVSDEIDRIVGLELGADDYVTKPFNPRELLARIKSVLKRVHSLPQQYTEETSSCLLFEDWSLDLDRQMLTHTMNKEEIFLSTIEFRLLKTFLNYPGIVLSRDQLLDLVSNRTGEVFDRSIDNQVSRLRKKIEADPKRPDIIKTVWGGGYMLSTKVKKS